MSLEQQKLDHKTPIPLYFQLRTILLDEIQKGSYPVGSTIPTETEISDIFQISRSTVRQAIAELAQEGWLDRKTSKGTFVTRPQKNVSLIRSFEPFYQQVAKTGKRPRTELLRMSVVEAGENIASYLEVDPSSKIISMFRKRYADDVPMVTMQNYLPYSLCSSILSHDFEQESLYEVLSQSPEYRNAVTKTFISAQNANAEDAELLCVKLGAPILHFNTLTRVENDNIVNFGLSRYRGDMNEFEIDVSVSQ
jgi:GntR family transcriptional regulator